MNGTFMFGEDRFDSSEDFSVHYQIIGGKLPKQEVNQIIRSAYNYLGHKYPDETYRHNFPSVRNAIDTVVKQDIPEKEIHNLIDTFAFHELGHIPEPYIDALYKLSERFLLSVVIDIWSPKKLWLETFDNLEINKLFLVSSFSSDHGMVKPSPEPFELVVNQLNVPKEQCLIIGDSPRRDLGGALAADIDCILVGGATDNRALGAFPNLLALCEELHQLDY